MIGLGTLINTASIIAGGFVGLLFKNAMTEKQQESLSAACGVGTLFLGISGAIQGMIRIDDGKLTGYNSMLVVLSLAIGAFIGELLDLDGAFERFGEWLKVKTKNSKDKDFVDAFVTTSLTVSIGAMAILGSIRDGLVGDYSILAVKAVLDFIIVAVLCCSLGKGCVFSAIPVFVFEGTLTLLASLIAPVMTDQALANLSLVGSILIFCVGLNLLFGKKVRVANFLPAVILAAVAAFLPFFFLSQ
ncbi:MAG: DUF554 domain-containing protein [Oscillospiraceae bacterium]|nr:DUF554 domain-containing protein [Oscillospiraceae bacterium]